MRAVCNRMLHILAVSSVAQIAQPIIAVVSVVVTHFQASRFRSQEPCCHSIVDINRYMNAVESR